jgi:hypothetical protein
MLRKFVFRFALDLWNCHTLYEWQGHICKQIKQPWDIIMNPKPPVYESFYWNASALTTCLMQASCLSHSEVLTSLDIWTTMFAMQKIYLQSNHQPLITMPHLSIVIIISAVPRFLGDFNMNFQNNPYREPPRLSPGFAGEGQRPRTKPPLGHYSQLCNWNGAYIIFEFGFWLFVQRLFINYHYNTA